MHDVWLLRLLHSRLETYFTSDEAGCSDHVIVRAASTSPPAHLLHLRPHHFYSSASST